MRNSKKNLSSSDFVFNCLKHKSTQYVWEIRDCWYVAHGVYYMLVAWSDQQQAKDCWMGVWLGNILTEETARRMLEGGCLMHSNRHADISWLGTTFYPQEAFLYTESIPV